MLTSIAEVAGVLLGSAGLIIAPVHLWRMTENRHNPSRRSFRHTRRWRGGFACTEHWLQSS